GDKDVWPYAIYPTNTGGFVVSGVLYRLANLGNPIYTGGFLMNVDVNGNVLWTHSFVDPVNFSNPNHAKIFYDLTTDGQDIYVVGLNRDPSLSGSVSEHPMVAKFDPSGNFLWGEIHGSLLRNRSYKSIFQSSINPDLYFSGFDHWGPANSRLMMTRMPITGSTGNGTCQVSFQLTRLVEITDQTSVSVNTSKVNLSINTNYQRGFSLIDHADCSTPNLRKASTLTIKSSSKELRIYPNPASQKLNFQMDESSIRSIKLFDTQGKLVKSYLPVSKNNFVALDVSKLPKGLYMVEVTNEDKILHSKVLIE
ncbi:MAG: T9SS type A sorting domain-containing protein, partial [Bacteroidia bacterium]|nr:T9SS type A sorting domain-containing protein [Bacteroidia bacterium]